LPLPFIVRPVPQDVYPLKSIKPIVELPVSFWENLFFLLPVLVNIFIFTLIPLIVFIVLLVTLHKKQKMQLTELIPPPPVQVSQYYLNALQELNERALWQSGEVKAYHSNLSFILRSYLEKRYHIKALEHTTSEILEDLHLHLTRHQLDELEWLLRMVDLVKFAKTEPKATFHEEAYQSVKNFIANTDNSNLLLTTNTAPVIQASKKTFLINEAEEEIELALSLSRFWARLIDGVTAMVLFSSIAIIAFFYQKEQGVNLTESLTNAAVLATVLMLLFSLVMFVLEWRTGRTIGKYLLKMKLVQKDGGKLKFGWILLRSLIFNFGFIFIILLVSVSINISTGSRILLHDEWTKTRVIFLKNKQKQ
jgi:uncharacterized RDD family membrane protein YckC